MSIKTKYLTEEDIKKFDNFIQETINKYFYVEPWDKLTSNTGKDSYDIISYKSTIPDLVIYNKTFNKSKCFLYSNKNSKFIKFPRKQFLLRPKKIKNYNPSNTYGSEEKKEVENYDEQKILEKPFEFKSIPKEIEEKYSHNNNNKNENNKNNIIDNNVELFDELKDFMKSDKDNINEIKVKIIKENEKQVNQGSQDDQDNQVEEQKNQEKKDEKDKETDKKIKNKDKNKNRKFSNNRNFPKNKFEAPLNINNMNNMNINNVNNKNLNINPNMNNNAYNNNYLKMMQYIQFQNHINRTLSIYNLNNNQLNKFNQTQNNANKDIIKNDNINNNNVNNNQIKDKNINNNIINTGNSNKNNLGALPYFQNNNLVERQDIETIMSDMEYFYKKNENKRGWKVVDKNNIIVNKFNNEQLYFFLKTINSREGDKNFSITDLDDDILFNPLDIYEHLKKKYEK